MPEYGPVKLLKAEAGCVLLVNLVDGALEQLPGVLGVVRIHLHLVPEGLDRNLRLILGHLGEG